MLMPALKSHYNYSALLYHAMLGLIIYICRQEQSYVVDVGNTMPTNENIHYITFLICRHHISCIHTITFLLLVENSQAQYTTLYACKNMQKGIATVAKVAKHIQTAGYI